MMKFFQSQVDKRQQKLRQEDCEFEISLDCIRRWCLRRTQTTKKKPKYLTSSKVCVLCVCVFLILPVSGTMSEFHGLGGMRGDTGRGEAKTLLAGGGRGQGGKGDMPFTKSPTSQGHLDDFMVYQKVKGTSRRGQTLWDQCYHQIIHTNCKHKPRGEASVCSPGVAKGVISKELTQTFEVLNLVLKRSHLWSSQWLIRKLRWADIALACSNQGLLDKASVLSCFQALEMKCKVQVAAQTPRQQLWVTLNAKGFLCHLKHFHCFSSLRFILQGREMKIKMFQNTTESAKAC